jgi:hypothetical protein
MNTLMQRAAPGLALATVTLGTVWWVDPAFDSTPDAAAARTAEDPTATADEAMPQGSSSPGEDPDPAIPAGGCDTAAATIGDPTQTQWGPVQVELVVAEDGTICSSRAVVYPNADSRSARINAWAIPELDSLAVSEGVAFDAISGATYTSEAYRQSMQSILDRS